MYNIKIIIMFIEYNFFTETTHPLKDGLIKYPYDFRGLYSSNYAFGTKISLEETELIFKQIRKQYPKAEIGSLYTDRLTSWEGDYKSAIKKATGKDLGTGAFGNMSIEEINIFIKEYIGNKKCKILSVVPFVNSSNGYPLWLLIYKIK